MRFLGQKVEAMGDLAGVRARLPHHTVGLFVPTGTSSSGPPAGQVAVRPAPVRLRGAPCHVSLAPGAVAGAALPAGGIL